MNLAESSQESLRRLFLSGFTARDVAEPLISFDDCSRAEEVLQTMSQQDFDIVGIRQNGQLTCFVEKASLQTGNCREVMKPIEPGMCLPDSAVLKQVVTGLSQQPRLFVTFLGQIRGIITPTDLQKPPLRMWLFGLITLIEMRWNRMIQLHFPGDGWKSSLSEARLAKAELLQVERGRRNIHVDLLSCLQISDKGQIIVKNRELLERTKFASRRQAEEVVKRFEALRNNLAHSQDILAEDWESIVLLAENLEFVLSGPESKPNSS